MNTLEFSDLAFDFLGKIRIFCKQIANLFLALAEATTIIGIPSTGLFKNLQIRTDIDDFTQTRNPFAIKDVKLHLLERRSNLVLHNLDSGFVADHFVCTLNGAHSTNIETHR